MGVPFFFTACFCSYLLLQSHTQIVWRSLENICFVSTRVAQFCSKSQPSFSTQAVLAGRNTHFFSSQWSMIIFLVLFSCFVLSFPLSLRLSVAFSVGLKSWLKHDLHGSKHSQPKLCQNTGHPSKSVRLLFMIFMCGFLSISTEFRTKVNVSIVFCVGRWVFEIFITMWKKSFPFELGFLDKQSSFSFSIQSVFFFSFSYVWQKVFLCANNRPRTEKLITNHIHSHKHVRLIRCRVFFSRLVLNYLSNQHTTNIIKLLWRCFKLSKSTLWRICRNSCQISNNVCVDDGWLMLKKNKSHTDISTVPSREKPKKKISWKIDSQRWDMNYKEYNENSLLSNASGKWVFKENENYIHSQQEE